MTLLTGVTFSQTIVTTLNVNAQLAYDFSFYTGPLPSCCIAINSNTQLAYEIGQNGVAQGIVTVIDLTQNAIVNTISSQPSEFYPDGIAVNSVTNKVYIPAGSGSNSQFVAVMDGSTNQISMIPFPIAPTGFLQPGAVDVNTVTNQVYITAADINNTTWVAVMDGSTNQISIFPTAVTICGGSSSIDVPIAVNSVTNQVYISGCTENGTGTTAIAVIDGSTNQISLPPVPPFYYCGLFNSPNYIAVNSVTNKVYITGCDGTAHGILAVMDGGTNQISIMPLLPNPRSGSIVQAASTYTT